MSKQPTKRKNAVFYDLAELPAHGNDLIKKLTAAINNAHDRIDELSAGAPAVTIVPQGQSTAPAPATPAAPFQQRWFKLQTLVNDDVHDVYVDPDLGLIRFGPHGVRLSHTGVSPAMQWVMGYDGEDGADSYVPGPVGLSGVAGLMGVPGSDGEDGADGWPGRDGASGAEGRMGASGYDGDDGDDGWPGPTGAQGPTVFVQARWGCYVTHDFTPIGAGLAKLRYEVDLIYAKTTDGAVLLEFGTAMGAANMFQFTTSTTTWGLSAVNLNSVTFPSPAAERHRVIVEFDGTNGLTGKDQWKVWVDNISQTLSNVIDGNCNGLNTAIIYASGGQWADPAVNPHVAATLLFDGAIIRDRLFTDITGTLTPPTTGYTGARSLVMWTDARDILCSEHVENGRGLLDQTVPDAFPVPGTMTVLPWILDFNSSVTALDTAGLATPLYCTRLAPAPRVYGFPGQFVISNANVPLGGVEVEWIVATPNVARVYNRAARGAQEQKWSLFHSTVGTNLDTADLAWYRTAANFTNPENI